MPHSNSSDKAGAANPLPLRYYHKGGAFVYYVNM